MVRNWVSFYKHKVTKGNWKKKRIWKVVAAVTWWMKKIRTNPFVYPLCNKNFSTPFPSSETLSLHLATATTTITTTPLPLPISSLQHPPLLVGFMCVGDGKILLAMGKI